MASERLTAFQRDHGGCNKYEESLIQEVLKGKNQREAFAASLYASENYSDIAMAKKASRVLARPRVRKRLNELKQRLRDKVSDEVILEVTDVLRQMKDLLETDISDVAEIITEDVPIKDKKGNYLFKEDGSILTEKVQRVLIKDTKDMTKAALRSISEVGHNQHGVYVKRYNKNKTIDQVGKYLKMFTEQVEVTGDITHEVNINIGPVSDNED